TRSQYHLAGIVAAEVELHQVLGLDPRLTASIPPYRRHAALLEHVRGSGQADHFRVSMQGMVFGVDAESDHVPVPFVYNLDVMQTLFGDGVSVTQSELGKFQTRAAEKFGG